MSSKDYLNADKDHFNVTPRLSNRPKIFLFLVLGVLFGLIFYIIASSKQEQSADFTGIETVEHRLDNDEYVKNMANNKGYFSDNNDDGKNYLDNLNEEDFNAIFGKQLDFGKNQDNFSIDDKIIDMVEKSNQPSYPPLPVSQIDDNSTIEITELDDETEQTVNLTAEQITTYNNNRFSELQAALKAPTSIYSNSADNNKNKNQQVAQVDEEMTYEDKLNMILQKTGYNKDIEETQVSDNSLLQGNYELQHRVQKARKGEIKTGFVIPATLITEINSSVKGTVIGQVRQNIYDTATGKYLLIPQGTKVIGEYESDVPYGNERLFMSWKRIVFPNGSSLDLDIMPGADMTGRAGFHDKVNTHFWKIFGNALLFSLIITGTNITTSDSLFDYFLPVYARDITSSMGDALALSLGETMSEMIRKNLNIAPEITIRSGYLFNIMVTKDIVLPVYKEISNPYQ